MQQGEGSVSHIRVEEERAVLPEPNKEECTQTPSRVSASFQSAGTEQREYSEDRNRESLDLLSARTNIQGQKGSEVRNGNRVAATASQQKLETQAAREPVLPTTDEKLSAAFRATQAEGSKITREALSRRAGVRKQTTLEWLRKRQEYETNSDESYPTVQQGNYGLPDRT